MPLVVVGTCTHCEKEVKLDDKRDAARLPIMQRAEKLGRLICPACSAEGFTPVDRDNPPDVRSKT